MLVIRSRSFLGRTEYEIHVLESARHSDEQLIKMLGDAFGDAVIARARYLTEDGRRVEGEVIDMPDFGLGHAADLDRLRNDHGVSVRRYEYNDLADTPEAARQAPRLESVPDWVRPIAREAFESAKSSFLAGLESAELVHNAERLLLIADRWGPQACEQAVALLFALFFRGRFTAGSSIEVASVLSRLNLPLPEGFRFLISAKSWVAQGRPPDRGAQVADWASLAQMIVERDWTDRFRAPADLGPYWGWPFADAPLSKDPALARLRASETTLEDFVNLAGMVPPAGYAIETLLSYRSAFKVVYRGRSPEGETVALKRYKSFAGDRMVDVMRRLGMSPDDVLRKDSATRWTGDLRHTHILPCSVVRNEAGEPFIVEPLLDATLDRLPRDVDRVDLRAWMRQAFEALAYLHAKGWVHSDLKPDNIGVQNREAVLLDFGIASMHVDRPRDNPGSIKTRAPELFSPEAIPTFASDLWALGATAMAVAGGGEYPLLGRDEVAQLPPPGDERRQAVEDMISTRIREYQEDPRLLEERIRAAMPDGHAALREVAIRTCRMRPDERLAAKDAARLLDDQAP